jgi:hypothetical protein
VWATLKLRDAEIHGSPGNWFKKSCHSKLRNASEEKDATILELRQAAETMCAALEAEKKKIEGKSPLSILCLPLGFAEIRSRLIFFSFSGLRATLGTSATQEEALQAAYNSSQ